MNFFSGSGPGTRKFDETSVNGQMMLRSPELVNKMNETLGQVRDGSYSGFVAFNRSLGADGLKGVVNYLPDLAHDIIGANPTRGYQGSINGGKITASDSFYDNDGNEVVTLNIKFTDTTGAASAGHLPPKFWLPKNDPQRYGATILNANPFGPFGPMRDTIQEYNLKVTAPIDGVPWQATPTYDFIK